MMKASQSIKQYIKSEENLRLEAYDDATGETIREGHSWIGNPTIGYGHELMLPTTELTKAITLPEAEALFESDVTRAENAIIRHTPMPIPQEVFDALVSFVYNIGENQYANSQVCQFVNAHSFVQAAEHLVQFCHNSHGTILAGLFKRRIQEAAIMLGLEVNYRKE